MTPRETAEANVKDFARKLMLSALDREQEVLRSNEGGNVMQVLAAYTHMLRQLTDHCADRFAWVDKQPDQQEDWNHGASWKEFSFQQLHDLYQVLNNRLNPVVSQCKDSTETLTDAMSRFVTMYLQVQTDLHHHLDAQIQDSKGKEIQKQTDRADLWREDRRKAYLTAALSALVGLIVGFTLAPLKQSNSCQNNSVVPSSTQAQTPQISGTPRPLVPPSADPPPVSHPGLATPSSTPQPSQAHPGGRHA